MVESIVEDATQERLRVLEAYVARLEAQARGERYRVIGRSNPKRIAELFGVFAGDADAEAVQKEIEAAREKEREEARRADIEAE